MYSRGSKRHSLQAVELSQWTQAAVQIVSNLPAPSNGGPIYRFWACRPCGPAGWLLTKAGDVETNPGPTTLNKKVWICDICHKQIHVRKQISIRCNRIEHWVHLRCAGGGSPMFPLVVHQPASLSIWSAVQSLRRGLSTNPGATMWCVCGCS